MASTTDDRLQVSEVLEHPEATGAAVHSRLMAREAGRALEILGHAIEYLADEYVRDNSSAPAKAGMLEAIQMLMTLNREIYFSRPRTKMVRQRLHDFLGLRSPRPKS